MGEAAMVAELMPEPIVQVRDFHKRYRKQVAVDGVDLEIQRGEIYGLIGPDGAGKSSLMKAIAGVLAFESGSLEVLGIQIDSERTAELVKGRLGFMPQGLGLNLYGDLSVEENIDFFAQLREVPSRLLAERKSRLLAMTRLDRFLDRPMKQLSGGMKQKLLIAIAISKESDTLIFDEPTANLDPKGRESFYQLLESIKEDKILLFITHRLDEIEHLVNRVVYMDLGKVVSDERL